MEVKEDCLTLDFMNEWDKEQLEAFQTARETGDWTAYKATYMKGVETQPYKTADEVRSEMEIETRSFNTVEESNAFLKDKIDYCEKLNMINEEVEVPNEDDTLSRKEEIN